MRVPQLGVGAVYGPSLHPLFEQHPDIIQVAEIEPSTFWIKAEGAAGALRSNPLTLERIASLPQAKLVHGVGFPIGGTVCDRDAHVDGQRLWADRLGAPWTSEHLSFNETAGRGNAGFLLPPCQSEEGVAVAAANIRVRAAALGRPFAFETGVNYLPHRPGEMDDGDYFAAVAEAADCHILLDLHNLWANERNGRAPVREVVAALPLERVCEIHLAGGLEKDGYWLDAHSGPIPPALYGLALDIVPDLPALGAILFEIGQQHADRLSQSQFLGQIESLHRLWERRGQRPLRRRTAKAPAGTGSAAGWEDALVGALAALPGPDDTPPIALYRMLIATFRKGAIADMLPHSVRLLQLSHGEPAVEAMLADYVAATPPHLYPSDEGLQFAAWLAANGPETRYLDDVLALEAGIVRIASSGGGGEISLNHDPDSLLLAIAEGRLPDALPAGAYQISLGMH